MSVRVVARTSSPMPLSANDGPPLASIMIRLAIGIDALDGTFEYQASDDGLSLHIVFPLEIPADARALPTAQEIVGGIGARVGLPEWPWTITVTEADPESMQPIDLEALASLLHTTPGMAAVISTLPGFPDSHASAFGRMWERRDVLGYLATRQRNR